MQDVNPRVPALILNESHPRLFPSSHKVRRVPHGNRRRTKVVRARVCQCLPHGLADITHVVRFADRLVCDIGRGRGFNIVVCLTADTLSVTLGVMVDAAQIWVVHNARNHHGTCRRKDCGGVRLSEGCSQKGREGGPETGWCPLLLRGIYEKPKKVLATHPWQNAPLHQARPSKSRSG